MLITTHSTALLYVVRVQLLKPNDQVEKVVEIPTATVRMPYRWLLAPVTGIQTLAAPNVAAPAL